MLKEYRAKIHNILLYGNHTMLNGSGIISRCVTYSMPEITRPVILENPSRYIYDVLVILSVYSTNLNLNWFVKNIRIGPKFRKSFLRDNPEYKSILDLFK